MNSRYKDKLVGLYAPSSHGHTSVLGQTQELSYLNAGAVTG